MTTIITISRYKRHLLPILETFESTLVCENQNIFFIYITSYPSGNGVRPGQNKVFKVKCPISKHGTIIMLIYQYILLKWLCIFHQYILQFMGISVTHSSFVFNKNKIYSTVFCVGNKAKPIVLTHFLKGKVAALRLA